MGESGRYFPGFGNDVSTEAVEGTLPIGRNSPQRPARGLYAEQLSGSAFTAPRAANKRTWTYRIRPSVIHGAFEPLHGLAIESGPFSNEHLTPTQLRWDPIELSRSGADFLEGLVTLCGNGSTLEQRGIAVHVYGFDRPMSTRFFYSADGEWLFVPWEGVLRLKTELGVLEVAPGSIGVVPRGVKYQVEEARGGRARGYICENYGQPFRLPDLGPIGSNGLAQPRDFETPAAAFEERAGQFELVAKLGGRLYRASIRHSPLDVVAWHGNYAPYRYDLSRFNTIGTVSFDHPDPSIFTVLTSPSELAGTANCDFVIFPPRWMVAEDTFRPPYFHRNTMSEFMGLVKGTYDAKADGFLPGGSSLHNAMSGHGPDRATFETATQAALKPQKIDDSLAFMFESRYVFLPTAWAMTTPHRQRNYPDCWQDLPVKFRP